MSGQQVSSQRVTFFQSDDMRNEIPSLISLFFQESINKTPIRDKAKPILPHLNNLPLYEDMGKDFF